MSTPNDGIRVEHLSFDSDSFGAPVFRLAIPERAVGDDELKVAIDEAREHGAWLISARVPDGAPVADQLSAEGFQEIECLVTFRWDATRVAPVIPDPRVRLATIADAPDCAAIGARAFTFDRYHADPRVSNDAADAFKATWVTNNVLGRADCALVALDPQGQIVGFNLLLAARAHAVIDLIAVEPNESRSGHGRALILASQHQYRGLGGIEVGTQDTNLASLSLYRATGFSEVRRQRTFHWVDEPT
jgi:ribosomal protein S18 acetylase RimI-like enzyme